MEMSSSYLLGFSFGILVALAVWLIYRLAGKKKCAGSFDERQLAAQGRAAKAAFLTNIVYDAACIGFSALSGAAWFTLPMAMLLGILLSAGVYAILCILHDAYFNLSNSPRKTILALTLIAAAQFLSAWSPISDEGLFLAGRPNFIPLMSLGTGITLSLVLVTALVKLALDRRSTENADEES